MGRIRDAYEAKFRQLLGELRPRRLELGVQLLVDRAERLSRRDGLPLPRALALVYDRALEQIRRRQAGGIACRRSPSAATNRAGTGVPADLQSATPDPTPPADAASTVFTCDAGLGGLARWLRAAGYDARWRPRIGDDELLREARQLPAYLLTTDSLLMERGVLRDGLIPALWVPPSLKKSEQIELVLRELRLPVRDPRCMNCGGSLESVDKESVRDRIPPRTYVWRHDYFRCTRCDKLFWHGTHWEQIERRLQAMNRPGALSEPGA